MKNKVSASTTLQIGDLKEGDILLCPPNDMVGKIIVKLTGGIVSHSAIYLGSIKGTPTLAHAHIHGILYNTLEELFTTYNESVCYVRRNPGLQTAGSIAQAANHYIAEGNAYSFSNLTTLAVLAVFGKLSAHTIKSKLYYDILVRLTLSLMKELNQALQKGKHPMTCSQFVAQCYTNKDYTIGFDKLIVDTMMHKKAASKTTSAKLNKARTQQSAPSGILPHNIPEHQAPDADITSLWTIMQHTHIVPPMALDLQASPIPPEVGTTEWNNRIATDLMQLLEADNSATPPTNTVSNQLIAHEGAQLLGVLYRLDAVRKLQGGTRVNDMQPTDRNFFVTPDDLYYNATGFVHVGSFTQDILGGGTLHRV